jgi:hypothetical protein
MNAEFDKNKAIAGNPAVDKDLLEKALKAVDELRKAGVRPDTGIVPSMTRGKPIVRAPGAYPVARFPKKPA